MKVWREGVWIFELNEIQWELKFFKIKEERKRGERGVFEIFIAGEIAGDKTSNRKQNFRIILKCFHELYNKLFKQLYCLIVLSV